MIRFPPTHTHTHTRTASLVRSRGWADGQRVDCPTPMSMGSGGSVGYPCSEPGQMWPPRWTRCVWPRPFMFFTAIRHRWLPDLFFNPQQCFGVTSHVSTVRFGQAGHSGRTQDFPPYWKLDRQQKTQHATYSCVIPRLISYFHTVSISEERKASAFRVSKTLRVGLVHK